MSVPAKAATGMFVLMMFLSPAFAVDQGPGSAQRGETLFSIERSVAHQGFDGQTCWVHARAGAVPPGAPGNDSSEPLIVMTTQKLLLSGSDVFYRLHQLRSDDLGTGWTTPSPIDSFAREVVPGEGAEMPKGGAGNADLLQPGDETTVCDFSPMWHSASQRLLGIGQTVWYRDNRVMHTRPRQIAYAVMDPKKNRWDEWQTLTLPDEERFRNAGSGSAQRVDLPGGETLIPFYFKEPTATQYSTAVCRCRFDGRRLHFIEMGNEMTVPVKRGLYEPSIAESAGVFYLTMRNDDRGYVSRSEDGLVFEEPRPWTFDDGSDLGNYNTQQHWVTHNDALYLVYTRKGADNDHVFRHRAPLFIARVDKSTLRVIRATERVLVPEHGARLGNFGVVDVSADESWVIAAEWMQPEGVERFGSDNRIHIAKLKWDDPKPADASDGSMSSVDAGRKVAPYHQPPPGLDADSSDLRSPLQFADGSSVQTPEQWERRRREIHHKWHSLLGKWPPLLTNPDVAILESIRRENFTQHSVRFRWTPDETTTGYLLVPQNPGRKPAVVTVYYEPETAIGLGKPYRDFAVQLARRGFVTLSIGSKEATASKTYSLYYPSIDDAQVQPLSMLAYAAANAWHVLADRADVDADRIGIVGHSFGGKWAMFASCLFDQYACAAWSDPGIVFDEDRPSVNYWEPWYLGYHARPWRKRGRITDQNPAEGLYPNLVAQGHDLHELHCLMAPRPFLVSGGSEDPIERWRPLRHARAVNEILGFDDRVAMTNRPDHSPNADSNEIIYSFFEHWLKANDKRGD